MPEKKPKIPLTGVVKIPESIDREIDKEASELGLFKYQVVLAAWRAYLKHRARRGSQIVYVDSNVLLDANFTSTAPEGVIEYAADQVSTLLGPLTADEVEYLRTVVEIDRSNVPGLPGALRANVGMFKTLKDLHGRVGTIPREAGEQDQVGRTHEAIAALAAADDELKRKLEDLGGVEARKRASEMGAVKRPRKRRVPGIAKEGKQTR